MSHGPITGKGRKAGERQFAIQCLIALVWSAVALWGCWEYSDNRLRNEAIEAGQREAQKKAQPGYAVGYEMGHHAGMRGARNPNDKFMAALAKKAAKDRGEWFDEDWGWNYLLGYREGLIAGWDEAGIGK